MNLRHQQTQFLTQAPDPVTGQLLGFIAGSFRVFTIMTDGSASETSSTPLNMTIVGLDALNSEDDTIVFVTDGSISTNLLYAVNVSNPAAPAIVGQLEIS